MFWTTSVRVKRLSTSTRFCSAGLQLKSNFADFANIGGREGGAITAAAFLGKFTQGLKWAHLDVAGTAYQGGAQKGSTGRPTPLLADFLLQRAAR